MELSPPFENAFLSPPVHNLLSASSPQGALFGASPTSVFIVGRPRRNAARLPYSRRPCGLGTGPAAGRPDLTIVPHTAHT